MPDVNTTTPPDRREPTAWDAPQWPVDHGLGRPAAGRHREVLAMSMIALVLSFAMVEIPGGRVALRGFRSHPLPPSCASRSLFGVQCPGCGLTRSFIHLAEGDWRASWRAHRLGWLMAAVVVFQVPYRLLALRRPDRPVLPKRSAATIAGILIFLLIANWLVDVVMGRLTSL